MTGERMPSLLPPATSTRPSASATEAAPLGTTDLAGRDPCAARHLRNVCAQNEPRRTKHGKDQKRDQGR